MNLIHPSIFLEFSAKGSVHKRTIDRIRNKVPGNELDWEITRTVFNFRIHTGTRGLDQRFLISFPVSLPNEPGKCRD